MKIKEFVESNIITQEELESLIISKYVPIQRKRDLAKAILDKCVVYEDGFVTIDEVHQKIYSVVAILSEYTCLAFTSDYDEMIMEYDELFANTRLEIDCLITFVGKDVVEFKRVIEMEKRTILSKNSVEAQIAKVAEGLMNTINNLSQNLEGKIGELIPEGTDLKSLIGFLDNMN